MQPSDRQDANIPSQQEFSSQEPPASAMGYDPTRCASDGFQRPTERIANSQNRPRGLRPPDATREASFIDQSFSSSWTAPYDEQTSAILPRSEAPPGDWDPHPPDDPFQDQEIEAYPPHHPSSADAGEPSPMLHRLAVFGVDVDTSPIIPHDIPPHAGLHSSQSGQSPSPPRSSRHSAAASPRRDREEFTATVDAARPRDGRNGSSFTRDAFHSPRYPYQEDQHQWQQGDSSKQGDYAHHPQWQQPPYGATGPNMHHSHYPYHPPPYPPPYPYPEYHREQEERAQMHPHAQKQLDPVPPWQGRDYPCSGGHWPYAPGYPREEPRTDHWYPPPYAGYYGGGYNKSAPSGMPQHSGPYAGEAKTRGRGSSADQHTDQSTHTAPVASRATSCSDDGPVTEPKPAKAKPPKDPDKPKRPLSAYNLFFRDERVRMLQELDSTKPSANQSNEGSNETDNGERKATDDNSRQRKRKRRKGGGGVGFKPMAQRVAAKWKALDRKALAHYEELAAKDLQRYKTEMDKWREKKRLLGKESPIDDLDDEDSKDLL